MGDKKIYRLIDLVKRLDRDKIMFLHWESGRKFWPFFAALVLAFVMPWYAADAAPGIPRIISYQGRLTNASGNLLGGSSGANYYFRFSLHSDLSGGAQLWPANDATPCTHTLTVKEGVFNAGIGDTSECSDALGYNFRDARKPR